MSTRLSAALATDGMRIMASRGMAKAQIDKSASHQTVRIVIVITSTLSKYYPDGCPVSCMNIVGELTA
jgi:hypothetical protein